MPRTSAIGAALFLLLAGVSASLAGSREDFLTDAIKGDNSEIRLGGLAARNAHNPAVRDYGKTLVSDHTQGKREAVQLAKQLGVSPPSGAMLKADAEYVKLRVLSGKSFDREFVGYMIEDHKQDIRDFNKMARTHNGPVANLAEQTLPVLHKHLRIAEDLERKL